MVTGLATQLVSRRAGLRAAALVLAGWLLCLSLISWGLFSWAHLWLPFLSVGLLSPAPAGVSVEVRDLTLESLNEIALFTVNHSCSDEDWEAFTDTHRRELILIAHYLNQKALEFEPNRAPDIAQSLSPREVDAITLLAIGYNRAQVADTLSISEHTLRVYIESARFKLGALNTTHAVARALSRGLIVV